MINYIKCFLGDDHDKDRAKISQPLIAGTLDKSEQVQDLNAILTLDENTVNLEDKTQETPQPEDPTPSNDRKSSYDLVDYEVQPNDTLYGIAISYSMNPTVIKMDNNLTNDEVYPGQVIKVRVRNENQTEDVQSKDKQPDENIKEIEDKTKSLEAKIGTAEDNQEDHKNRVRSESMCSNTSTELSAPYSDHFLYYCTSIGEIEGTLTLSGSKLVFSPISLKKSNLKSREQEGQEENNNCIEDYEKKYLSQFGAEIDLLDIAECNIMSVPSATCEDHFDVNKEYVKDYVIQLILYGHGHRSMGKYLNDLFSTLKGNKVPYACIHLKLKNEIDEEHEYSNKQKDIISRKMQAKILANKQLLQDKGEAPAGTELPYFEFLFDKFKKNDATILRKISRKESASLPSLTELDREKIMNDTYDEEEKKDDIYQEIVPKTRKRMMIPKIVSESQILNLEQFTELINCVPELYQTLEWKLRYSTMVHGTSYQNLLRRTQHNSPSIIVIRDENDFVFGAYCNNELWFSNNYYGNGETFLFTFRDLNEITVFDWSKKNHFFVYVSEEGITFGGGNHYGLWISNDLVKGRSYESETFNNQQLSYKTDFKALKLEVWSIIDPFTTPEENRMSFSEIEKTELEASSVQDLISG